MKIQRLDKQYAIWLKTVLKKGETVATRNSITKQYFGLHPLVIENVEKEFPYLTFKPFPFYRAAQETMFFLSGGNKFEDMPKSLTTSWWAPWAKEAEQKNSWGRFYSTQWRNQISSNGKRFDQLQYVLTELEKQETSRRAVVSLWRAEDFLEEYCDDPAVLPSCHSTVLQFNRVGVYLDLIHYQRSLDLCCGINADLIYSGLVMHLIAKYLGLHPRKFVYHTGNAHIYYSHYLMAQQLAKDLSKLALDPEFYPKVEINFTPNFQELPIKDIKNIKKLITFHCPPTTLSQNYKFDLIK